MPSQYDAIDRQWPRAESTIELASFTALRALRLCSLIRRRTILRSSLRSEASVRQSFSNRRLAMRSPSVGWGGWEGWFLDFFERPPRGFFSPIRLRKYGRKLARWRVRSSFRKVASEAGLGWVGFS